MKIACFVFVAYVVVMTATVAELSSKQNSVRNKKYMVKVSNDNNNKKENEYLRHLKLSSYKKSLNPESQENTDIWRNVELFRLSDSYFELLFKLQNSGLTNYVPIVVKILYSKDLDSINHENQYKATVIQNYEENMNTTVIPSGLFIDSELPFLTALPDGLIGNDSIIMVKFPYTTKHFSMKGKLNLKGKELDDKYEVLALQESLKYIHQIQGQLHITKRKFCHFLTWTIKGTSMRIIEREDEFWKNEMVDFLEEFYLMHLLPEIINPQYSNYLS